MGYYIETNERFNNAAFLKAHHDAKEVTQQQFLTLDPSTHGLVVVIDNGFFEAVAFCYNANERAAFTSFGDYRPKQFLVMDRKLAERLSNFN